MVDSIIMLCNCCGVNVMICLAFQHVFHIASPLSIIVCLFVKGQLVGVDKSCNLYLSKRVLVKLLMVSNFQPLEVTEVQFIDRRN